jgi:ParB family chromosome partitioning protein
MTTDYDVIEIPLSEIYSSDDFNCRGTISFIDVVDLAKSIEKDGLLSPIVVQSASNINLPPGYKYRIIAGHRRFIAFRVLKRETIPAMVRNNLSEVQARLLNLGENLKRSALNIMQEATAVRKLRDLGLTQEIIASELQISRGWVQVRFNLLDLPEAIQKEAAAGILNQAQIKQIYSLKDPDQQYAAVKKIKNSQVQGIRGIDVGKKAEEKPFTRKRRSKVQVQEMIDYLGEHVGYGLHTRVLAWANGAISTADLYFDIKDESDKQGKPYTIPFMKDK